MHPNTRRRVLAPLAVLLLAITVASCGDEPATTKRLTDQGPCDLAKLEDLEEIFGPAKSPGPEHDDHQCNYSFKDDELAISRAAEAARPGTEIEIEGVMAKKYEKDSTCSIDLWLTPGDINQQIGIFGIFSSDNVCDSAINVARVILKNTPD